MDKVSDEEDKKMKLTGNTLKRIVTGVLSEIDYRTMRRSIRDEEEGDRLRMIKRHGWDPLDNPWAQAPKTPEPPPWEPNLGLLDAIIVGDIISRARASGFRIRNMKVVGVTGESPNRVWELVPVNMDQAGNITFYHGPNWTELASPEPGIVEKVSEEEMSTRTSLWQLEKTPGMNYNFHKPTPKKHGRGSRYRPWGRST